MPRVKIDYVVSFSSETPEAPANNLLANEAGCGRWLCARGEASGSVLLQLTRSVQISSVTIGAHHAALVEVLVGRSETPNEPFQVLVASSVFLSPVESRRAEGAEAERVRTFRADQLVADVRARRWDRVRVVCSQPYNKHCKYGLSFIHIYSPEGDIQESTSHPAPVGLKLPFAMDEPESDDEFKPGTLFAQHRASQGDRTGTTDSQIRQATSQALKTQTDVSSKLVRAAISKPEGGRAAGERPAGDRRRDGLMYDDDDDKPDDKIDRLVNAHKEQQAKNAAEKTKEDKLKEKQNKHHKEDSSRNIDKRDNSKEREGKQKEKRKKDTHTHKAKEDENMTNQTSKRDRSSSSKQGRDDECSSKKQKITKDEDSSKKLCGGPVSATPHTLLSDVSFALSGYENPRRAAVRAAALAMGAAFRRDWGPGCTHLICAFPNTPKLKTVRSLPNGNSAIVVTAEWIERCAERRRRLPWQWFATEHELRVPRSRSASGEDPPECKRRKTTESECDTDDEIERVMRDKTRRKSNDADAKSPEGGSSSNKQETKEETMNSSRESDVAFVRDERMRGNVTVSDSDDATEPEDATEDTAIDIDDVEQLPSFFEGTTFALHCATKPTLDAKLVRRYVRAYGGEIVEPLDDEDIEVDYVLCLSGDLNSMKARGQKVRGDWVWTCHESRRLCSPGEFALT